MIRNSINQLLHFVGSVSAQQGGPVAPWMGQPHPLLIKLAVEAMNYELTY